MIVADFNDSPPSIGGLQPAPECASIWSHTQALWSFLMVAADARMAATDRAGQALVLIRTDSGG